MNAQDILERIANPTVPLAEREEWIVIAREFLDASPEERVRLFGTTDARSAEQK